MRAVLQRVTRGRVLVDEEVVDRESSAAAVLCRDRLLSLDKQPASRRRVIRLTTRKQRGKLGEELLKIVFPRKFGRLQGDEGLWILQNKDAHAFRTV